MQVALTTTTTTYDRGQQIAQGFLFDDGFFLRVQYLHR